MEKIKGYEEAQAYTGEYEKIRLGGHVCVVKFAHEEKTKSGKRMLVISYDIVGENDENKDYFSRKYEEAKKTNPNVLWNGRHWIVMEDDKGDCSSTFKGFTTSLEKSNSGYVWDWNEENLKGKKFGGVFGREEYIGSDGNSHMSTKIRYIRSIENIESAEVPKDKLLEPKEPTSALGFMAVEEDTNLPF